MPVTMYPSGKATLLGPTDLSAHDIKVTLVSASYTYSPSHEFFSDLTGTLGSSANLSSKTLTNGTFSAANTTVTANALATAVGFVLWRDTGNAATSPLLLYYDAIQIITIAANSSSSTTITVDPIPYEIAGSSVLTRVTGTGPSSVTLSASAASANARTLTAASAQSMVQGDTYSVAISGTGFPIAVNNGQTVNINGLASGIFSWNG